MSSDYYKRHFWLIGASSGIGAALAQSLINRGATVTISARRAGRLEDLASELGERCFALPLDVTDHQGLESATKELTKQRPADVVIYLAATYHPPSEGPIKPEEIKQIVDINLTGALQVAHTVKPMLTKRPDGRLILFGSAAAYRGLPNGQPYSATKAAILNLAESLHIEWKDELLVQVISSGFVDTDMTKKNTFKMPMLLSKEQATERILKQLPSRRFEIAYPWRFMTVIKLLRLLPYPVYFWLSRRMR
jgi:short-subunit dehydrogenase